jgi:hypothetical protein
MFMKKNKIVAILLFVGFIVFIPYLIKNSHHENASVPQKLQFDDLADLEVIAFKKPVQERDLEKYPLASMYYQHMNQMALQAHHSLTKHCNSIANKIKGVQCKIPDLKSFERTLEKVNNDYHGDFKKVLDLLRGSIVADNLATLRLAIQAFNQHYQIAQTKNRFKNPLDSGYRDFLEIFYDEEAKIYGEMQFHLTPIFAFKDQAHGFYETIRTIEGKAKLEQRELSKAEKEAIAELVQKSKAGYDQAFFNSLTK